MSIIPFYLPFLCLMSSFCPFLPLSSLTFRLTISFCLGSFPFFLSLHPPFFYFSLPTSSIFSSLPAHFSSFSFYISLPFSLISVSYNFLLSSSSFSFFYLSLLARCKFFSCVSFQTACSASAPATGTRRRSSFGRQQSRAGTHRQTPASSIAYT